MADLDFLARLDKADNFELRRVVERLREGLFDPLGVRLLTTRESKLKAAFDKGVKALDRNESFHLCICGDYGQGKSHTLNYIQQKALDQNFVVSHINLDPRQVPFYNFQAVYRALMEAMIFPNGDSSLISVWESFADRWLAAPENKRKNISDHLIPENIPHRFKAVLAAIAQKNLSISPKKRKLKKHARFKPATFSWILKAALKGKNIPAWRLASVFYYRQVSFYKEHSLVCNQSGQYFDMVHGLAELIKKMGFKGWIVLFDEGESITQTRITSRSQSYKLLNEIFYPKESACGFYPVIAFTNDFFDYIDNEEFDRVKIKKSRGNNTHTPVEIPYFHTDYSNAWKNINIHKLHALSSKEWEALITKLIEIHARAYKWKPSADLMQTQMENKLSGYPEIEARLKLKSLVNILDLEQQSRVVEYQLHA